MDLFEDTPIVFKIEELNVKSRAIHERGFRRAQNFIVSQAELVESVVEADEDKLYEKFGLDYLTTFCVKYWRLDETVSGTLVRLARKSQVIPEFRQALADKDISVSKSSVA